jgi:twinkle protein
LVVVTGRPGDGKSQWAFNWMLNLCRLYGLNGAVVQFEDDVERTRNDLLRYCANNKLTANWADEHVKVVLPCEDEEDVRDFAWIKELIKEAVERHNAKIVILDPWNEIEHLWDAKQNGADQLNHALRDLKKLARQYQIALVIVAHPDKSSGINQSVDEMSLYSINGGAAWKNKADHGIVVSREHDETGRPVGPVTWVKIDKSKNHERMGVPGKKKLIFDTATREYLGEGGEVT